MSTTQTTSNPFALMMDPDSVFEALARSDRLGRLKSRICRPLDKPLIAHADGEAGAEGELAASADGAAPGFELGDQASNC